MKILTGLSAWLGVLTAPSRPGTSRSATKEQIPSYFKKMG